MLQKRQHFETREFRLGNGVLVPDANFPRNQWALGKVVNTFRDSKGLIRKVKLQTKASETIQTITKLCLLQRNAMGC